MILAPSRKETLMAVNMRIEPTSGPRTVEVPEDVAADLSAAYDALKDLPLNRQVTTDPFPSESDARHFARQGKAWAQTQTGPNGRPLVFARRGTVKENPTVVSFRIYEARETGDGTAEASE